MDRVLVKQYKAEGKTADGKDVSFVVNVYMDKNGTLVFDDMPLGRFILVEL